MLGTGTTDRSLSNRNGSFKKPPRFLIRVASGFPLEKFLMFTPFRLIRDLTFY